ncbi:MAG: Ig-like domain-containing protein [Clostridia bacterium]|nr:Ig-like domain-containing protein [Clostridia bacterium]
MKKYLAILLSMLLMMSSVPMAIGAEAPALPEGPCFAVSYEEAKVGETVEVTISAVHNPGIVSTRVRVYFDTAVLKLTNIADGDFYAGGYSYGDVDTANERGNVIINWCYTIQADSTAELLATLTFEVLGGTYGPSAVTIEFSCEDDVYNYDWDTVNFEPYHGQVYVLYPVTGITLNASALALHNGDSAALTATVLAEGKTDDTVIWASDNPAVATVDAKGVVTATGLGNTTVTATTAEGGYVASCAVNVTCAHRRVTEVAAVDSTCIQHGHGAYTVCADCGIVLSGSDAELPLADHVYANACDAECDYCGAVREITHDYKAEVTAPTCVAFGYTVYTCTVCGHTYTGDEVPSLGHKVEIIKGYAPTCTVDGLTDSEVCTVCHEVVIPHQPIFAQGHVPADVAGYDPTCTADGLTHGAYCTVCDEVLAEQQVIPALGHSYDAVVTAPTCGAEGYTTYTCSACGDSYVADAVPATGEHTYDDRDDRECNGCDHVRNIAGDADGNEKVNNRDLGLLQKLLNETEVTVDQEALDMDGNGKINNRDLGLLQKMLNT